MNVLVVHEVDWKSKVVYEVHDIPELLSLRGHNCTVVDFDEHYKRKSTFDLVRWKTEIETPQHRAFANSVVQLRRPGLVKLPLLDRFSSIFLQYLEVRRAIKERNIDILFLYAMPTSGLSAICAAKGAGIPIVFRAIDVLHKLRGFPFAQGIWISEWLGYRSVDRIVSLTPKMKEYVCSMGAKAENVEHLLPGIDCGRFKPGPKEPELLKEYGLTPDHRIACFMGTMYDFTGLDYVIEHFPRVLKAVPNARLLLVGGAGVVEQFKQQAKRCGIEKEVVFTGFASYDLLPRLLRCADLTFNSFIDVRITRNVFPGKVPQYLGCGRAMLATPLPGLTTLLKEEEHGVVYRELGPGFIDAMIELLQDQPRLERLGANAAKYVEEFHDWERVTDRIEEIFQREIDKKPGVGKLPATICD